MSQGKFSIVFFSKYKTKNLVHMCLLLSEFSPSVLSINVGHALQLSKILSIFIKRKVCHSCWSSASFLGRDFIICVFISSHMDDLNLFPFKIFLFLLDCLPPIVRKFLSPPLVVWKCVKTSGKEFFSSKDVKIYLCLKANKIIHSGCDCYCFPSFVDSHHGHVISNINILSKHSLIELFSRGTTFKRAFLFVSSIEEVIDKSLKKFVNKQEELLGVQGISSEWKAKVRSFVCLCKRGLVLPPCFKPLLILLCLFL